ncbi:MAG: serine/threonine-protein kinase [Betaproteobacteria bacterium]
MPESLGHYNILERIGAGGLGEVFRARDTSLGRTVALKVVPPDIAVDPARREEFLRDARAAAALSHPNIATLYEIGEDGDALFLVQEFVPGLSLTNVIAGRPLNPRRAVGLAIQIADALADAHAADIVHGDLKPDNVIVTPKGAAKILDFGLSAWTRGGAARRAAAMLAPVDAATVQATIAYLAPEQAIGERGGARADIFSSGAILFAMLTGQPPFAGATTDAMVMEIARAQPERVTTMIAGLPPELEPILSRALAKSLQQRYETAATMAAELRAVAAIFDERASAAAEAGKQGASMNLARRSRLWPWVLIAAAAGFAGAWFERDALMRLVELVRR